jgi:predicted RNA methylase
MGNIATSALWHIRHEGLTGTLRHAAERLLELSYERYLRVDTANSVALSSLGIVDPEMQDYHPIPYSGLRSALRHFQIDEASDVFFDYGAGKGRAILIAALHRFRRIEGIELAPSLVTAAQANVARALPRLRCRDVHIAVADATVHSLPDDVTLVHFYNPFRGATLRAVVDRLAESLVRNPRRLTVLFAHPDDFECALREPGVALANYLEYQQAIPWRLAPHDPRRRLYSVFRFSSVA